ncbi:MAG: ABC transporter substrate-binding protein [Comamonadaceae bacterium CG_4_10_14_0_8_um_filter_57_29]|nr:MAG: ABC transporter substrate-binding protein [Comamonadaceae bacterium CG_4_10_14_0_8_um_filter_57_29]
MSGLGCHLLNQLRRLVWLGVGLLLLAPAWGASSTGAIRVGLPDSLFNMQYMLIGEWRQYLSDKLNRPVEIVFNKRFSNTTVQLYLETLDFAWVTDYPDVHLKNEVRLMAIPLSKGQPYFTSYLIVPAFNHNTASLLELKGALFAFTDPSQNGSYLDVRHELLMAGQDPNRFFSKIIFTGSHREVIKAVALGLAHAGEVDSNVWDSLAKSRPDLAARTRVVAKSLPYGAPPVVANHFVSKEDFKDMQSVLLGMAKDARGLELLKRIGLDGFMAGDEKVYERNAKMRQLLNE